MAQSTLSALQVPLHRFTELNLLRFSVPLGSYECNILSWGFFEPRWWRNYLHTHSFFEICYAFQGRGTFQMMGQEYAIGAGDLFVAKPAEPHEIISSHDAPLGIYFWSYTLVPACAHTENNGLNTLIQAFLTSRCWVSDRAPAMLRMLELLTEEVAAKAPGYVAAIEGLIVKLVLDTARAVTDLVVPAAPGLHPCRSADVVVQSVVQYLRDNYNRPVSVRDVAAQVHLSERQTSRLFHAAMHVSIMEYLTALRLETAAQLLLDHRRSIKEVAEACGYANVQHFTTLFHRRIGLTPAVFRHQGGTAFMPST